MLGRCKQCGGPVSDYAYRCPRCGCEDPYHRSPAEPVEVSPAPEPPSEPIKEHSSSGVPGWLSGILTLIVVIAAGAAAKHGAQTFMRDGVPAAQLALTSDAEIVARFEQSLTERSVGAAFVRMRTSFPDEYDRFLQGMVPIVRGGGSAEEQRNEAFRYAQSYMANFVRSQRPAMTRAEPEVVSRWVSAQVTTLTAVSNVSPQACAELVEVGSVTPQTGRSVYPTIQSEMGQSLEAVLAMIESGRRSPQAYEPLTEEELLALGDAALAAGADPAAMAAVGTPEFSLQPVAARCGVGIALYQAIASESDPLRRARLGVAMLNSE